MAQWLRYCSASCAIRVPGFAPRLGRSVGRRTIGLASPGLGRVGRGVLVAPATPVAGWAQCTLTKVARCTVRLASGLDVRCVKKQCGLVGWCIGLSTFVSPEPVREL